MPAAQPDPRERDAVIIGGQCKRFSEEVTQVLLEAGQRSNSRGD
jgi:hypothetical protein